MMITYQQVIDDSLTFKSDSNKLIEELEEIVKWIDGLMKLFKNYKDDLSSKY